MINSYIDQSQDPTRRVLYQLVQERPGLADLVKTAEIGDALTTKNSSAFADTYNRMFPVDSEANAVLSKAYATKVANLPSHVGRAIDTALEMYGSEFPETTQVKVAHEEPRYVLEDTKQFPIKVASDVPRAEEALTRIKTRLGTKTLAKAATVIVKAARDSNQNVGDNILRWAGLTQCDVEKTADWIEARRYVAPKGTAVFDKLADHVRGPDGPKTREDLLKLATALDTLDSEFEVTSQHGRKVPNPLETVFSTKTAMQNMVELAGKTFPIKKLVEVDPGVYSDLLGEDILEEITTEGQLDEHKIVEIFKTLPQDMKALLASKLG